MLDFSRPVILSPMFIHDHKTVLKTALTAKCHEDLAAQYKTEPGWLVEPTTIQIIQEQNAQISKIKFWTLSVSRIFRARTVKSQRD